MGKLSEQRFMSAQGRWSNTAVGEETLTRRGGKSSEHIRTHAMGVQISRLLRCLGSLSILLMTMGSLVRLIGLSHI